MVPKPHRICYVGYSPEIGRPAWPAAGPPPPRAAEIERSLGQLTVLQREIIERRFWRGHTLAQISRSLDIAPSQTRRELRRALTELRRCLDGSSAGMHDPRCRLCIHPQRHAIDRLLRTRDPHDTWQGYLRLLNLRFGITGLPAKALQSHLKHHTAIKEVTLDLT